MSLSRSTKLSDVLEVFAEQQFDREDWNNAVCATNTSKTSDKQTFTDAVYYCISLLTSSDRLTCTKSEVPSARAMMLGREMFELIMSLDVNGMEVARDDRGLDYRDNDNDEDEILMYEREGNVDSGRDYSRVETQVEVHREADKHDDATIPQEMLSISVHDEPKSPESCKSSSASETDDSTDEPYDKTRQQQFVFQLEMKKRVVNLANENPTWPLTKLRKDGSKLVRSFEQLRKWEKQIANGGTTRDKHDAVNTWTYTRFVEARDNFQRVTDDTIRDWAYQAANKYFGTDFNFPIDDNWLKKFRKLYEIRGNSKFGYYKKSEKKDTWTMLKK